MLHEAGYRCSVPSCRTILTIEIHHMEQVSEGGADDASNLLALCPTCHSLHHEGRIPDSSIRAWKAMQLTLNAAFDRRDVDALLALSILTDTLECSADKVLELGSLVSSGYVLADKVYGDTGSPAFGKFVVRLSEKGRLFVEAWKHGDLEAAVRARPLRRKRLQTPR